jgi:putative thiamine transport system ATP-binding protein
MTGDAAPTGLDLRQVSISLRERELITVSAHVGAGETLTVMGPSGSGKSSLLAFIAGLLPPGFTTRGEAWLGGSRIDRLPAEQRHAGLLFQDDLLFPHLSVGGNLAFALPAGVHGRRQRRLVIEEALARADLAGFGDRDPATLSGGQRARVAVLRVLLSRPQALLLDEPFSRLDAALRAQFRAFVFGEARARGLPTLLVTHDPVDAEAAGGRIITIAPSAASCTPA